MKTWHTHLFSQVRRGVPTALEHPGIPTGGHLAHHICGYCPVGCTRELQNKSEMGVRVSGLSLLTVCSRSSTLTLTALNKKACILQERKLRQAEVWLPQNHLFSIVVSGHMTQPLRDLLIEIREEHAQHVWALSPAGHLTLQRIHLQ